MALSDLQSLPRHTSAAASTTKPAASGQRVKDSIVSSALPVATIVVAGKGDPPGDRPQAGPPRGGGHKGGPPEKKGGCKKRIWPRGGEKPPQGVVGRGAGGPKPPPGG